MSISKFNKVAAEQGSSYIRFDDLEVGSHPVEKFSVLDKSNYGGKRLRAHLKDGYVILPERMSSRFANTKEIRKLNAGRFNLVYNGKIKEQSNRLDFRLELNTNAESNESDTGSNDDVSPSKKKVRGPAAKKKTGPATCDSDSESDSGDSDVAPAKKKTPDVPATKKRAESPKKKGSAVICYSDSEDESDDSDVATAKKKKLAVPAKKKRAESPKKKRSTAAKKKQ